MNTHATVEKMNQMKFYGMANAYQTSLQQKNGEQMPLDTLVGHLVDSEWLDRENRKTGRYMPGDSG